jgi:hypothetical protein
MQPTADRFGYKYQCAGNIFIDVTIEGDFDGSPVSDSLELQFGPGVDGDSYDAPHVMACCPELDLSAPFCEQPHEQFCMADLVEQGCKSMETNLRDFANDAFGGMSIEDAVKRSAVHKIADHVRDHQADCIKAFVENTGIGTIPPACDEDGNGVGYDSLLEAGSWSFDPDGLVTNVSISVPEANWDSVHPLDEAPGECLSANDNDGVLFLEIDPDPGSIKGRLTAGYAALYGPRDDGVIQGIAELDSTTLGCATGRCSEIAVVDDSAVGRGSLVNLQIYSTTPTMFGGVLVDAFELRLWNATAASFDARAGAFVVQPGHAWFAIRAVSGEWSGAITATNETELTIARTPEGWLTSALVVSYHDGIGGHWRLVVAPTQWH